MKPHILYVDDERENTIVFEATFEDHFHVLTASSGEEALALLQTSAVPVVVADHRMPGMTGVELCEIVRREHPHTKRIILTGYSDADAMLDAINKGQVFHFLTKPWDRHVLHSVLMNAVEAHDLEITNTALTDRLLASERCATLGRVVAEIAHEMGNQVSVLPLLELIEEQYSGQEDLMSLAHLARESHDRLLGLIEEIKDLVRSQQTDIQRRTTPLAEAIRELVSFLRFDESIPQQQLTLQLLAEPVVLGNKFKIQQVLINLLKNAADAIAGEPQGQITLTLDQEGGDAVIKVADNGCGIPADFRDNIWRPFFTTKRGKGTGLGLDVCRQLIAQHEGQISCEDNLPRGTTFCVRLPVLTGGRIWAPAAWEAKPGSADCQMSGELMS